MRTHTIRIGGVTVLRGEGRLVLGHAATQFLIAAERLLADCDVVALDLTGVWQMDAHGIGVIAQLFVSARHTGRTLLLAGASPRVQRLLRLTRLDTLIPAAPVLDAVGESRPCMGTARFGSASARSTAHTPGRMPVLAHSRTALPCGA